VIQRLTEENQARQPGVIQAQEVDPSPSSGDAPPRAAETPPGSAGPKE
jgi:hypothetical protein